jgi:hypothetical protein
MGIRRFDFEFDPLYRRAAALFGIRPATTWVTVNEWELTARFGPWQVRTPLANVVGTEITGGYGLLRTIGPAHLSFADRGLTMATNRERGVCMRFAEPVRGLEPTGRLRHPGLTVTVADCDGLIAALKTGF